MGRRDRAIIQTGADGLPVLAADSLNLQDADAGGVGGETRVVGPVWGERAPFVKMGAQGRKLEEIAELVGVQWREGRPL